MSQILFRDAALDQVSNMGMSLELLQGLPGTHPILHQGA
jgi:hypothetical protein